MGKAGMLMFVGGMVVEELLSDKMVVVKSGSAVVGIVLIACACMHIWEKHSNKVMQIYRTGSCPIFIVRESSHIHNIAKVCCCYCCVCSKPKKIWDFSAHNTWNTKHNFTLPNFVRLFKNLKIQKFS